MNTAKTRRHDEVEIHVHWPLALALWPDDNGPYYDWTSYEQHVLIEQMAFDANFPIDNVA